MRYILGGVALLVVQALALCQPAEPLILEDFGKPLTGRWRGGLELSEAEDGRKVGQWYAARQGDHLVLTDVPADWTPYKALEFWLWSADANGQQVMLLVYSENPDTDGIDYFSKSIVVEWKGWRQFAVPFASLKPSRKPDWKAVDSLAFATTGWNIEAKADTELYLGTIRLLTETPGLPKHPPDVVADFEEGDLQLWSGLARDTENVTEGESAGRWETPGRLGNVSVTLEMDWSPYQLLEFDCFSAAPTGDRFIINLLSMDEPRERNAYWAYIFRVDWEGWRHFAIPFRRLHRIRDPLGWQRVTGIQLYPNGWGMQANPSPDTVLTFDDMRLTKGEPRVPPPGTVEDFEDGPWAWWWMDEGSVPPHSGEHCGEFPLHEGWRSVEGDRLLTADWTPYKTLKLWVYAQHLDGEVLAIGVAGEGGDLQYEIPLDGEGWREATVPLTPNPGVVTRAMWFAIKGLHGDDTGKANRDLDPAAKLCLDDLKLE